MKILLDENIDVRVKLLFPTGMEIFTVKDMGWTGIKNGELIRLLSENDFNYWIVVDKNIPYQQNTINIPFTLIVLDIYRNTLKSIEAILPKVLETINKPIEEKKVFVIHEM